MLVMERGGPWGFLKRIGGEAMHKTRKAKRVEQPPFGAQWRSRGWPQGWHGRLWAL